MTVLQTENNTGSMNKSIITHNCLTGAYTAGANQRALIWAHLNCDLPAGYGIAMYPSYTTDNGASFGAAATYYSFQINPASTDAFMATDNFGTVTLTAGTTYKFATGSTVATSGTATVSGCQCKTFVEIVGN